MTIPEAYRLMSIMIAIGIVQSSLENCLLAIRLPAINQFRFGDTAMSNKYVNWMKFAFDTPGIWVVSFSKLFLAVGFLYSAIVDVSFWYLPLILIVLDLLNYQRYYYLSVSEVPLQRVVLVAISVHHLFNDPDISILAMVFVAIQVSIAYMAAGWHKLRSPYWQDGRSMSNFMWRYTGKKYEGFFRRTMPYWKWVGWFVIAFEVGFALSLLGGWAGVAILGIGIFFHGMISIGGGINFFFWTFVGCYPAIIYLSEQINAYLF